ncbi:class I SAM-dependent methyltransferase [Amycolatopsis rhizosphaerae]|uniref:Class I SAM-dependent methyltransferase n=1 Tax=Amycolatopsis rhizosphaerae TaxID=2053003 RepID=A0A558ANM9_9PSEU|nr:class I SAM-dependent methyltransferase [Amycolatopsis rhizosphaerae]TVT25869.1 class I SAM-dependent methyltransferase [Amycolatopsis rhizosphaerae]
MQTIANTGQAEAWNGYEGRHWAEERERYDAVNDGMNQPLLDAAAITPASRVLDIGCGTGRTTRLAAGQAVQGTATGIDLSAPMLAAARKAAWNDGIENVSFVQGDAQVHPFPDGSFDIAISRGGIMFFADPIAAFTNIARALRPGGRLAFVCPQNATPASDFAHALAPLLTLMRQAAPAAEADASPGPTSLAEPDVIRHVLTDSGFTGVTSTAITVPMVFGSDPEDASEFLFAMGPMRFNLSGADPDAVAGARAAVTANLREFESGPGVVLRADLWLVHATRTGAAA